MTNKILTTPFSILAASLVANDSTLTTEYWNDNSKFTENFACVIWFLDNYFSPLLIVMGVIGNSLSFAVFIYSHLRRISSSMYLAALSVADTGFLLCVALSWANNIGIHLYNTEGWCQLFTYANYVFSFLSVWLVVSFSCERYIAVCLPFKRQNMCTGRRAKIVVLSLIVIACVLYNFAIWTSGVSETSYGPFCHPVNEWFHLVTYLNNVDTLLTFVLPSLAIVALNMRIIYTVYTIYPTLKTGNKTVTLQPRKKPLTCNRSVISLPTSSTSQSVQQRQSKGQVKVTKMLVVVSTMFLILNCPSHLMRIFLFFKGLTNQAYQPTRVFHLTQRLFLYIYHSNFSINFFLYSICGRNFRQGMLHLRQRIHYKLCKCKRDKRVSRGDFQINEIHQNSRRRSKETPIIDLHGPAVQAPLHKSSSSSSSSNKFKRPIGLSRRPAMV